MKITVIGTGYVGLIQGVCLAELGNTVSCVDIDTDKIESLRNGRSPIYEPGLEKLIRKNIKAGRLFFTPSLAEAMTGCSVVFIAVGTPASPDGSADLRQIEQAATEIAQHISQPIIIAIKSTVPPGTCRKVRETVATRYAGDFAVLANPEFLREGSAVADFLKPDRIVIGGSEPAASQLAELYQPLKAPVLITSAETAEVIKYASNSFLATQISFINSIAHLCEKVGADVTEVAEGMKLDPRIGRRALLGAGLGYGGSCLPKDVNALIHTTRQHGIDFPVLEAVQHTNSHQYARFLEKVLATIGPEIKGKIVTLWGVSFKPMTDDIRHAPSLDIARALLGKGARLNIFDPVAEENFRRCFPQAALTCHPDPLEAAVGSHAVLLLTQWPQLADLDFAKLKQRMAVPLLIDGRNMYGKKQIAALTKVGITYLSVGR